MSWALVSFWKAYRAPPSTAPHAWTASFYIFTGLAVLSKGIIGLLFPVGVGVPALGKRGERVSSLIVAPTLAWALGIPPPAAAAEKVPREIAAGR